MPVTTSGLIAGMDNLRVHHPIGGLGRKYQGANTLGQVQH